MIHTQSVTRAKLELAHRAKPPDQRPTTNGQASSSCQRGFLFTAAHAASYSLHAWSVSIVEVRAMRAKPVKFGRVAEAVYRPPLPLQRNTAEWTHAWMDECMNA